MTYPRLVEHMRQLHHLRHVAAIVGWDEAVMMPSGGNRERASAMATLDGMIHRMHSDPRVGEWLDEVDTKACTPDELANFREISNAHRRACALPSELVQATSLACTRSEQGWRVMRADDDWAGFSRLLGDVVARKREEASCLSEVLGVSPYDALIDGYEPGIGTSQIDPLFDEISKFLPDLLARILDHQSRDPARRRANPTGPYDIDAQKKLGIECIRQLGFDFEHGRVDTSHHPFCGGGPRDVRITTRYDPEDFLSSLMGLVHESGHGMYEQGLPEAWLDQPLGLARSMAVHESQSLFYEMQIARSPAFWRWLAPRVEATFGADGGWATPDHLWRQVTRVERSAIRVDADEVSYPAHILLRYGIERRIFAGECEVEDIPEIWNLGMRELLDIDTSETYRDACMQDVHWPAGAFGYFPSYTLGALIAAQLVAAMRRDIVDVDFAIESGEFGAIKQWLSERVWQQASRSSTPELIESATGQPLGVADFRTHLENRYL